MASAVFPDGTRMVFAKDTTTGEDLMGLALEGGRRAQSLLRRGGPGRRATSDVRACANDVQRADWEISPTARWRAVERVGQTKSTCGRFGRETAAAGRCHGAAAAVVGRAVARILYLESERRGDEHLREGGSRFDRQSDADVQGSLFLYAVRRADYDVRRRPAF